MFRIEMLPAHHGDAILIEYGDESAPRRVLIDGGTPESYEAVDARLAQIGKKVALELLVVTHVDEDHIGGTLKQLVENPSRLQPAEVWFNAYRHLVPPDRLGPAQGEVLSTAITDLKWKWNAAFGGGSVVVPDEGPLKPIKLADGARITLLSPTWKKLGALVETWQSACATVGLSPGKGAKPADVLGKHAPPTSLDVETLLKAKFSSDSSKANGSSIAFLFEFEGKRALFGADAHPAVLLASLKRLQKEPLTIDAFKVCHHGSQNNTSPALLAALRCPRFLISTNGDTFGHPDPAGIARLVATSGPKTLYFNYDTDYTRPWAKASLRKKYEYEVEFPSEEAGRLVVDL